MTRLLVSVRDANEALEALAGGADLIDIKEPARGPLGAADRLVWESVLESVGGSVPVTAALGELLELDPTNSVYGLALVKAGLSQCAGRPGWRTRLKQLKDALPKGTGLVAVAYADATTANAPTPEEVLDSAIELGIGTLLIDTYAKANDNLWHSLCDNAVDSLIKKAHHDGLRVALAGSLDLLTLPRAMAHRPDWIAVRGAACDGGRSGRVTSVRVAALKEAISQLEPQKCDSP